MKQFSTLLFVLFLGSIVMQAQSLEQRLDTYFNSFPEDSLHGMVSISQKGAPVYQKYFGYADIDQEKRPDTLTKYKIGSVSKMYTATMIFQLIEEEKLTLDTPLSKFYPEIQDADSISIGRMLKHKSGLYNLTDDPNIKDWIYAEKSREDLLELIKSKENVFFPGSKTRYSNTNYVLLSMIAETITKQEYPDLLKNRIVDKIGLEMTQFGDSIDVESTTAIGYAFKDKSHEPIESTHVSGPLGAGAIISTPEEMNMFMTALFDGQFISTKSLGEMTYESGMNSENFQSRIIHGHEGNIDGFSAYSGYFPKDNLAFAYAFNGMNTNEFSRESFIKAILDIKERKTIAVETKTLEPFVGTYDLNSFKVMVALDDETLTMATDNGMPPLALKPMSATEYFNKDFNIEVEFDSAEAPTTLTVKIFGQAPMIGTKL